jgi:hypothetical protein
MNESNYGQHGNEGSGRASADHQVPHDPRPYWKRAHHDWRVWVALVFVLTAIAMYVLSENAAFQPRT